MDREHLKKQTIFSIEWWIKIILFFIVSLLLLTNQSAYGQNELSQLITYSLGHSHAAKKSDLKIEESEYIYKEVRGKGLPQIEGSASYSKMMFKLDLPESIGQMVPEQYRSMIDQIGNIDHIYTASAGIQITQLIYSQAYWVGLKTAKKTQELYSILKTKDDEEIISDVAQTYYQTGSLMLQLQTIELSIDNINKLYKVAELNYKNDLIKETDLNRLKVSMSNLEANRQSLKNSIDIQLNYLKVIAGMPADYTLTINPTSFIKDFQSQKAVDFNIDNVPAYQALMKQDELYAQQVKVSKSDWYPTLAAYGQFNFSSFGFKAKIDKMTNMNTIGLNLKVPIFTSGTTNAKVRQSILKREQLKEEMIQNKELLQVQYSSAFSEYQTACYLLKTQKENRDLAQKVYQQTLLQYQESMATMSDLLNVNSDFLQADNSYNQQVLKCKTSEIKMLKATGNLKNLTR